MGLTIQGDGQTPSTVYNWRVYLLSTGAAFGAFLFGYCASFIGTMLALPSWTSQFGSDSTLAANVVTSFQCAAFGGSFLAFPLAENFGRVRTIQVATCIFLVGAVVSEYLRRRLLDKRVVMLNLSLVALLSSSDADNR